MTAAYRLLFEKKSPQQIIAEMKRYGWDPEDDHALLVHLDRIMPTVAHRLIAHGVLTASDLPQTLPSLSTTPHAPAQAPAKQVSLNNAAPHL